jgi:hypothetical protein
MWYLIWALTLVSGILLIVQNAARMERKSDQSLKKPPSKGPSRKTSASLPKDHK